MDSWKIWNESLGKPKYILAPMVDHSELPWRMLSKELGFDACYTPMLHASNFLAQKKYRQKFFTTCHEDNPLIVQFCANNASVLVEAAKMVQDSCQAIDLNLGCPQEIARRGRYGAFLQDEWKLINEMVSGLRNNLTEHIGISCKIRRFDELQKTIDYAKMLEKAGCSFIGLHGRTREQRGVKTGLADWNCIKVVKENVGIPVIANGNIQSYRDAQNCLEFTKVDAIMTAEGNLYNPAILKNIHPPAWEMAYKYLDYVDKYPVAPGMAKSHIFKLFHRCVGIDYNKGLRGELGDSHSLAEIRHVVHKFEQKYKVEDEDQSVEISLQPVPPYLCQPNYRYADPLMPMKATAKCEENRVDCVKRIKLNG